MEELGKDLQTLTTAVQDLTGQLTQKAKPVRKTLQRGSGFSSSTTQYGCGNIRVGGLDRRGGACASDEQALLVRKTAQPSAIQGTRRTLSQNPREIPVEQDARGSRGDPKAIEQHQGECRTHWSWLEVIPLGRRRVHHSATEAAINQYSDGGHIRIDLREVNHPPSTFVSFPVSSLEEGKHHADQEILRHGHLCDGSCRTWFEC